MDTGKIGVLDSYYFGMAGVAGWEFPLSRMIIKGSEFIILCETPVTLPEY